MSSPTTPSRTAPPSSAADPASGLSKLYYVRFAFAVIWALVIALTASSLTPATLVILVIYPLFDVAAAVVDFRTSHGDRPKAPLYVNVALSLVTALGLTVFAGSGIPGILRIWGAWAISAGLVQLILAIMRYRVGGQWAMILSGGISTVAGASFIAQSGGSAVSLTSIAGYATLGGIFFLVSAIRLHRLAGRDER